MFKQMEDFQKLGKDQFDAMTAASKSFSSGLQKIAEESTDFTKKYFENANAATEKLISAKSLDAVVDIQSEFARKSYDDFVSQSKKFSDLCAGLAREGFKPVEAAMAQPKASK